MADKLSASPYRTFELEPGVQAPFYILPFDEQGRCQAPLTRNQLLATYQHEAYTDVLLFSHGWNTDWQGAVNSYEHFLNGYTAMRRSHSLTYSRPFRPLLIGIFWPSIALVMPWENAPNFAGVPGDSSQWMDAQVEQEQREIQSIAASLPPEKVERFYELAQRGSDVKPSEALELAQILLPIYNSGVEDDLLAKTGDLSDIELLLIWQKVARSIPKQFALDDAGEFGFAAETQEGAEGTTDTPVAAGPLDFLDPRWIIRLMTILQMKDRAGVVGASGVGSLLKALLTLGTARVHLIGHSYGCKVILSALCSPKHSRPVNSVLLLQPAISYLCFALNATGTGQPGGYREALKRVEQPILTTYSSQDGPLTRIFHLAVRRPDDLGEIRIAGAPPPSRYAALGGYGPGGCDDDCRETALKALGDPYSLSGRKIQVLNGSHAITGHGDISNTYIWWALYNQLSN